MRHGAAGGRKTLLPAKQQLIRGQSVLLSTWRSSSIWDGWYCIVEGVNCTEHGLQMGAGTNS